MNLLERLKAEVLDPLAPWWAPLFSRHGLDIARPLDALAAELERPLPIDRTAAGFEDLALGAYRAIEPGQPGRSLLYHALASPNVSPTATGALFPTLEQLDLVENYVYSRARARLDMFVDPVVAVFAYQYRERDHTTHRAHADLAFSRTGIARIGTEPSAYLPDRRGFDPRPERGDRGFRALPARYAAFIAERRPQPPNGSVMRGVVCDAGLTFLFPVHKLFPGDECLFRLDDNGEPVPVPIADVTFVERHINEKLSRIHRPDDNLGFIPPMKVPAFELTRAPFVRDSRHDPDMVYLRRIGASMLVEPVAGPLVSVATQRVNGKVEVARFVVPKPATVHGRRNRYWSTFEIPARGESRAAPEYVNIRAEVRHEKDGVVLVDLNEATPAEFDKKISEGGYEAAHFADNSCDGALTVEPFRELGALPVLPAYSLVTAVDYFPRVDQMEIEEWIEKRQGRSIGLGDVEEQFPQGSPQPMSDGRFEWRRATGEVVPTRQLPNCTLPHPIRAGERAFSVADPANYTATAVIGAAPTSRSVGVPTTSRRAPSWLPDGASDVFAPGWDVSQHQIDNQNMYAAYGLGSPFPEDAKLCAALNSFWPAVAPDSARTYGWRPPKPFSRNGDQLKTSIPLTDGELGYHAQHPRVAAGEVPLQRGWDGDYGPFVVTIGGQRYVDAANPMRADQTRAALQGQVGFSGLDTVGTRDFIRRMEALRWCRKHINADGFNVAAAWLVTFETVDDWAGWQSVVLPKANAELTGPGMILVFAATTPGTEYGTLPLRRRFPIQRTLEVHMSDIDRFADLAAVLDDTVEPKVFYRLDGLAFVKHE